MGRSSESELSTDCISGPNSSGTKSKIHQCLYGSNLGVTVYLRLRDELANGRLSWTGGTTLESVSD